MPNKFDLSSQREYFDYLKKRSFSKKIIRKFFFWKLSRNFEGYVLDAGCGLGDFLDVYRNSEGCDMNIFCVKYCNSRGHKAYVLDLEKDKIKGHFDGIFCSHTLEHFKNYLKVMGKFDDVLKMGGRMVILLPNEIDFAKDPTHNPKFSLDDILNWLGKHSYTYKKTNLFGTPLLVKSNDIVIVAEKQELILTQ